MMRSATFYFSLFISLYTTAQESTYRQDLSALKRHLQNTASYKAQIISQQKVAYEKLYQKLYLDTTNSINSFNYFYNLSQLLFPLRDNHLAFYQLPDYANFSSPQRIDSFTKTKSFFDYPHVDIDIDSLQAALSHTPIDSVEGIYHYGSFFSVGVFKQKENEYVGVIVNSTINLWVKGQIAIHLYKRGNNQFKAIYGHPLYKHFIFQPIEKYQQQALINSYFYASYYNGIYTKQMNATDYATLPKQAKKFALQHIDNNVQYLAIRSFQADNITATASKQFCDSIQNALQAKHLILDLRNNEGGAAKETTKYFKLLKEYVRHGKLYILLNNSTISQAEIFTLQLKALQQVTTMGQPTRGMLAYGSNYGKTETLPSRKFAIYLTDMNNGGHLLPYEDTGIVPDILLQNNSNWMDQVMAYIKNN